jgi:hypothetical protein
MRLAAKCRAKVAKSQLRLKTSTGQLEERGTSPGGLPGLGAKSKRRRSTQLAATHFATMLGRQIGATTTAS